MVRKEAALCRFCHSELSGEMSSDEDSSASIDDNSVALSTTQEILREDLVEVMAGLSPRERDVLNLRFGLEDGQQRTIKEVSLLLGLDQERVRQIERNSLTKLRSTHIGRRSSQSDSAKSSTRTVEGKKKPS